MQVWALSHGRDGTAVELQEVPLWALLLTEAGEWLADASHPVFCCQPEWTFKLTYAPPDEDEEPDEDGEVYNSHTLGAALFRFGNWLINPFGAYRHYVTKVSLPVTPEWVQEHMPDAGWPWDGSSGDEARWTPQDPG